MISTAFLCTNRGSEESKGIEGIVIESYIEEAPRRE
jgi:hypothetical protein